MDDIRANADQDKPGQGGLPSPAPAESEIKDDKTVGKGGKANNADASSQTMAKPWRIQETVARWWEFVKNPDFTNPAIAIATIVIAFATVLTYLEVRSGSTQTDKIIAADQRMAKAMEDSFGLAQQTFAATVQQAEIAQRAWVYAVVNPASPERFTAGKPFDVRVTIRNTGRTPALKVRSVTYTKTFPKGSPDFSLPREPIYEEKDYIEAGTLAPDSIRFADRRYGVNEESVKRIENEEVRMYVLGRVEYYDVFKTAHWAKFCSYLLPGGDFAVCPKYNDMDDNQPSDFIPKPN